MNDYAGSSSSSRTLGCRSRACACEELGSNDRLSASANDLGSVADRQASARADLDTSSRDYTVAGGDKLAE